jgi:DNA-directed RNA polymerase subunit RPC12/RpoP
VRRPGTRTSVESNYPPGTDLTVLREWVMYRCEDCDREWEVEHVKDMGTWSAEGDTRCPGCKKEGNPCLM